MGGGEGQRREGKGQGKSAVRRLTRRASRGGGDESESGFRPLWWCRSCKDFSSYCSLCQLPLRGSAFVCIGCGHGGHASCLKHWFKSSVECATGCGCRCAELAVNMLYRQRTATARSTVYDSDDEGEEEEEEEMKEMRKKRRRTAQTHSSCSKSVQSDDSSASDSYSDSDSDVGGDGDGDGELRGRGGNGSFDRYQAYFGKRAIM